MHQQHLEKAKDGEEGCKFIFGVYWIKWDINPTDIHPNKNPGPDVLYFVKWSDNNPFTSSGVGGTVSTHPPFK